MSKTYFDIEFKKRVDNMLSMIYSIDQSFSVEPRVVKETLKQFSVFDNIDNNTILDLLLLKDPYDVIAQATALYNKEVMVLKAQNRFDQKAGGKTAINIAREYLGIDRITLMSKRGLPSRTKSYWGGIINNILVIIEGENRMPANTEIYKICDEFWNAYDKLVKWEENQRGITKWMEGKED